MKKFFRKNIIKTILSATLTLEVFGTCGNVNAVRLGSDEGLKILSTLSQGSGEIAKIARSALSVIDFIGSDVDLKPYITDDELTKLQLKVDITSIVADWTSEQKYYFEALPEDRQRALLNLAMRLQNTPRCRGMDRLNTCMYLIAPDNDLDVKTIDKPYSRIIGLSRPCRYMIIVNYKRMMAFFKLKKSGLKDNLAHYGWKSVYADFGKSEICRQTCESAIGKFPAEYSYQDVLKEVYEKTFPRFVEGTKQSMQWTLLYYDPQYHEKSWFRRSVNRPLPFQGPPPMMGFGSGCEDTESPEPARPTEDTAPQAPTTIDSALLEELFPDSEIVWTVPSEEGELP